MVEYDKNVDPRQREDSEDKVISTLLQQPLTNGIIISVSSEQDLIVTLFVVFSAFFISPTSECLGPILELNVSLGHPLFIIIISSRLSERPTRNAEASQENFQ